MSTAEVGGGGAGDHGPAEPAPANSIIALARDLIRLEGLLLDRPHPMLGQPSITPTMLQAGVGRNVTPPRATALLDVRTTPCWSHAALAEALRAVLDGEVKVVSDRLVPCETPPGSRLLAVASRVRPQARRFGSPTASDWVFLADRDALKCGPGDSRLSHAPDEHVAIEAVSEARAFYRALAEGYLS